MSEIIPRNIWCPIARAGRPARIPTPTPRLWLHHGASGTSDIRTAIAYVRYHINTNGWHDIGYSFLIAEGKVLEGRGAGRAGAHTRGDNHGSHGICMVGHYESRRPSTRDMDALAWLVRHGHGRRWWPATFTGGHRDAPGARTSCPGTALWRELPNINRQATSTPDPAPVKGEDMPAEWAKDAWEKVTRLGLMNGERPRDPVTRQELAVVLDRLGVEFLARQNQELGRLDPATDGSALRHLIEDLRARR